MHKQLSSKKEAVNYAVLEYHKAKQSAGDNKVKVVNGTLSKLIEQAKEQFPLLDKNFEVSRALIAARIKAGRLTVSQIPPLNCLKTNCLRMKVTVMKRMMKRK